MWHLKRLKELDLCSVKSKEHLFQFYYEIETDVHCSALLNNTNLLKTFMKKIKTKLGHTVKNPQLLQHPLKMDNLIFGTF